MCWVVTASFLKTLFMVLLNTSDVEEADFDNSVLNIGAVWNIFVCLHFM